MKTEAANNSKCNNKHHSLKWAITQKVKTINSEENKTPLNRGEKTALINIGIGIAVSEEIKEEFSLLAQAANADILLELSFNRGEIEAKYFIGLGQAELVAEKVKELGCELAIFNANLSPSQERNLEKILNCRVLDRSGLVLDIFAQRARSHEGKLQVELAQLTHLSTRLVRSWTHLERQKGGIGLRGPGETQLETDRRLLTQRIKQLKKRLEKVEHKREENRKGRKDIPVVALAGYTNSGKSTLFNALTEADVLAKNQLFATLDPTWRALKNSPQTIILADTVGFISNLPHELVAAFKSTLRESAEADLILEVIDYHDQRYLEREAVVKEVLTEIGADTVPVLRVFNKIDLTDTEPQIVENEDGSVKTVFISAKTGAGLDLLRDAIIKAVSGNYFEGELLITPQNLALRSALYKEKAVISESFDENGNSLLKIKLPQNLYNFLKAKHGMVYA